MEHLHPEGRAVLAEQRPLRPEADVAPGVVVEPGERFRQPGRRLLGDRGDLASAPLHVLEAEARLRRRLRWRRRIWILGLLGEQDRWRSGKAQGGRKPAQNMAAVQHRHSQSVFSSPVATNIHCRSDLRP
ncbi:MAG: hypothetical protein ACTHP8_23725 [Bosea sp. (in: a-proteobacteria)]|uniref:hypothetical protein n=1 Tax=Bosea sp. (in: a-proteobacteria) TaxID=1871050 RepID=UPI003F7C4B06